TTVASDRAGDRLGRAVVVDERGGNLDAAAAPQLEDQLRRPAVERAFDRGLNVGEAHLARGAAADIDEAALAELEVRCGGAQREYEEEQGDQREPDHDERGLARRGRV